MYVCVCVCVWGGHFISRYNYTWSKFTFNDAATVICGPANLSNSYMD